jgi:hypothetical protein
MFSHITSIRLPIVYKNLFTWVILSYFSKNTLELSFVQTSFKMHKWLLWCHHNWCTPKLLYGLNYESKDEDRVCGFRCGEMNIRSWGVLFGSQHFRGRGVCWSSGMGNTKIDKQVNYSHGPTQTKQQVG